MDTSEGEIEKRLNRILARTAKQKLQKAFPETAASKLPRGASRAALGCAEPASPRFPERCAPKPAGGRTSRNVLPGTRPPRPSAPSSPNRGHGVLIPAEAFVKREGGCQFQKGNSGSFLRLRSRDSVTSESGAHPKPRSQNSGGLPADRGSRTLQFPRRVPRTAEIQSPDSGKGTQEPLLEVPARLFQSCRNVSRDEDRTPAFRQVQGISNTRNPRRTGGNHSSKPRSQNLWRASRRP